MSIMTLADIKAHLRVTISDDDALIQAKIDAAEKFVEDYLGDMPYHNGGVPNPIKEAIRQLVALMYDNREAAVVGNTITVTALTPGFYEFLAPYKRYAF